MKATLATSAGAVAGCSGDDGLSDSHERVPALDYLSPNRESAPRRYEGASRMKSQLEELGFAINHNAVDFSTYVDELFAQNFDVIQSQITGRAERIDPYNHLTVWLHSDFDEDGGTNYLSFSNAEYDEVVSESNTTYDREQRRELVHRAQEILCEEVPAVVQTYYSTLVARRTDQFDGWVRNVGAAPLTNVWTLSSLEPTGDATGATFATVNAPSTLNVMAYADSFVHRFLTFFYDTLVRIDENGQPVPWAADDWTVVDDTTVDFHLREGMTFHDGEPVRPEDVQFSIEYFTEWEQPFLASYYQRVEDVEIDGQTLRFHLPEPFAPFITIPVPNLPILPQHVWDGVVEEQGLGHPSEWQDPDLTASGPLKVVEAVRGERVEYEVHEDHFQDWGVDRFTVQQFGNQTAAIGELERGGASYVRAITAPQFNRLEGVDGVEPVSQTTHGVRWLGFNHNRSLFQDRTLRRAVAHAIDQQDIVEVVLQGHGTPGISANPISPVNEFWHNPDVRTYEGGLERARELLEGAGYAWDDSGRLMRPVE